MYKQISFKRLIAISCAVFMYYTAHAQEQQNEAEQRRRHTINASIEAKISSALISKKYNTDETTRRSLFRMCYEQRLEIYRTLSDYANAPDLESRLTSVISKHDSITELYVEAAKNKGLIKNKVLKASDHSKFAAAIRLRKELVLSNTQVDSLMFHTNKMPSLRKSAVGFNPKEYERQVLPNILTDDQYGKLLRFIHRDKALSGAKNDWAELNERGVAAGLDSVKVIRDIMNYNMAKWIISDRYGNKIPKSASLKNLETPIPAAMQRLRTARKYSNPIPKKNSSSAFTW